MRLIETKNTTVVVLLVLVAVGLYFRFYEPATQKEIFTSETEDMQFTTDLINMASKLKGSSDMATAKNTLEFVADYVTYKGDVEISYCYSESAQTVFDTKQGDCVSMTRLTTALLRINNISVKTVGGCIRFGPSCKSLFSVSPEWFTAQVSDIQDMKKRGYMHEWSEAYLDGQWYTLENTAGKIFPLECENYMKYDYDSNRYDRCVINSIDFFDTCKEWR